MLSFELDFPVRMKSCWNGIDIAHVIPSQEEGGYKNTCTSVQSTNVWQFYSITTYFCIIGQKKKEKNILFSERNSLLLIRLQLQYSVWSCGVWERILHNLIGLGLKKKILASWRFFACLKIEVFKTLWLPIFILLTWAAKVYRDVAILKSLNLQ